MRKLRITPLNIGSALLLTWLLWQVVDGALSGTTITWIFVLLLVLVVADQFFRLLLRSLKRVWIAEGIFVVFVVLAIWILKVW